MADALVCQLRAALEARLQEQDHGFLPADLERLKPDAYLKRCMQHQENDVKGALEMIWDTLTWRKSIGASGLDETNINMDYIREGACFPHGRDVDGCLLMVFKSKMFVKGQKDFEELKKCIVYWFDRVERQENGAPIVLFIDLQGCGLSTMDIDFHKYLILTMRLYYPLMLNYFILFEMPWALSATFKVMKKMAPAGAASKMNFLNKANLKEFVAPEQALVSWGGRNKYEFVFTPEWKEATSPDHTPKKIKFAEQGGGQHSLGEKLRLSTNNTIMFESTNDEISGQFSLTNMDESAISFKIGTNSPEKFYVRPCAGTLAKGASQTVLITVQSGIQLGTVTKDRFLVMYLQIPRTTLTADEISEVWQKSSDSKVDEYCLECLFPENEVEAYGNLLDGPRRRSLLSTLDRIQTNCEAITADIKFVKRLQVIILFLFFVSVVVVFIGALLIRQQ